VLHRSGIEYAATGPGGLEKSISRVRGVLHSSGIEYAAKQGLEALRRASVKCVGALHACELGAGDECV
jgi:hypothetical protein